jgi:hypothetical protein
VSGAVCWASREALADPTAARAVGTVSGKTCCGAPSSSLLEGVGEWLRERPSSNGSGAELKSKEAASSKVGAKLPCEAGVSGVVSGGHVVSSVSSPAVLHL